MVPPRAIPRRVRPMLMEVKPAQLGDRGQPRVDGHFGLAWGR
jgi:hypothetical protein